MTRAACYGIGFVIACLYAFYSGAFDRAYDAFHGYEPCPPGTHTAHHVVDVYDLSPLGGGVGVAGHGIGDVIGVEGVCWPDDKAGG